MQASGTKRAHDETEAAQPEVEQTPTGESAAQEDERPASTAHHEEAEESTAPQAKRSRTEKDAEDASTPTEVASDAAATEAATEAAPAASDDSGHAAGEQQQQQGYAGQGDYSGYGSASAAVDYSTGGYDPQAYAAYAGHYDPSMAYGGYGASGYAAAAAAGSAAAAPPAAAAPAVPSAPIPDSHSPDPPSKVLHFRNVTSELTQEDIMELAAPFGTVEKVVMLTSKNQALLEFADIAAAISMSNFYLSTQPNIRGRKVYMRFSRHQQLTASAAGPNRILLVTLQTEQEPVIPITADIVWQIFSSYGFIEKIVVMNRQSQEYAEESRRDSRLQTLVQFSSPASAQTASQYLNGKTVYVGTDPIMSITLFIQYSHLTQLTVKHNSASARDYITPLPWGHQYQQPAPYQQPPPYGAPGYGYPPMPMPMPGMHGHGMPPPHHHHHHHGGGGY